MINKFLRNIEIIKGNLYLYSYNQPDLDLSKLTTVNRLYLTKYRQNDLKATDVVKKLINYEI